MLSGHSLGFWHLGIGPWQQVIDPAVGMAIDDPGDHVRQIGHRLDAVELRRFNQ